MVAQYCKCTKYHRTGHFQWLFFVLWISPKKNYTELTFFWKDPDAGKDWGQEEKGMKEDEMVGWHHQLNGHEFG